MNEVSRLRFVVLRIAYALITFGQVVTFWPKLLSHSSEWALKFGDTNALLAGMTILMAFGIRYPIRMLPIMLFEFTWKSIWLIAIYLPLARAGQVDSATKESLAAIGVAVILCALIIPWGFVAKRYVIEPAERWLSPDKPAS